MAQWPSGQHPRCATRVNATTHACPAPYPSPCAVKANAKTLGKQLKEERPGAETAADVVAEVARQRMLALAAAARTEDLRPPTPAPLKSGHAIGKGASFGSHVCV